MESNNKFDFELVIKVFNEANQSEDPPILPITVALDEFVKLFARFGTVMSMAFADVKEKSGILKELTTKYGKETMHELIKEEIKLGVEKLNGDNNKKLTKEKELHKYISGARTMLRMMWFMDYLHSMFSQMKSSPEKKMSVICLEAYNVAFGEKHAFIVRQGAKLGMKTAPNRTNIGKYLTNKDDCSSEEVDKIANSIAESIFPVKEKLWKIYRDNGYDTLP